MNCGQCPMHRVTRGFAGLGQEEGWQTWYPYYEAPTYEEPTSWETVWGTVESVLEKIPGVLTAIKGQPAPVVVRPVAPAISTDLLLLGGVLLGAYLLLGKKSKSR